MNQVGLSIPSIILESPQPNPDLWNLTETLWENTFRKWDEINLITDINFQHLDLFEDEQITLTQTIQDIRDIEKVFTDFSRTFNLPASSINNRLFKHYYRRDIVSDATPDAIFDANSKLDAILELNYKPFRAGYIVMNGVKLKNNVPDSYNITFYGQTIRLKDRVKDRKLSSLDFSQFNHDYNATTVKQGVETFVTQLNDQTVSVPHIIYPLISHTQRFIFDSLNQGVLTSQDRSQLTRNLYTNECGSQITTGSGATERLSSTQGFQFTDLKPALRIIDIIKVIEQDPNINIKFTDDFFKETGFFADLYMWLHRNKGDIGITPSNSSGTNLIVLDKISSFTGDVIEFFDSTGGLTPPHSFTGFSPVFDGGIFRFKTGILGSTQFDEIERMRVTWTVTPTVNTKSFTVRLRKTGTNETIVEQEHISGTAATTIDHLFESVDPLSLEDNNIEFVIETTETALTVSYVLTCQKILEEIATGTTTYSVQPQTIAPTGVVDTIYITEQIPDMKILNFLTSLFKTFNLTAFVDNDVNSSTFDQVKVQTLDDFYAGGTTRDITEFVKIDESESNFSVPFNDIEFKFSEPKTFASYYYDRLNSREYGSVKASNAPNSGRDPRLNRGQDYRVEVGFEKVLYERLTDQNNDASTNIGFGYFVDDNQNSVVANPLMFVRKNTSSPSPQKIMMHSGIDASTPAYLATYNRPSNFRQGTSNVTLTVASAESSSITFSYFDSNNATQTATVAPNNNTTINNVITNSVVITSNFDNISNITIAYTEVTENQTINFSTEIDPFIPTIDTETLFKTYYRNYLSDIFSFNRRLVKVKAILPQSFLINYKLSDTIVIANEEFIINKITTNLQTGESSLELLNKI